MNAHKMVIGFFIFVFLISFSTAGWAQETSPEPVIDGGQVQNPGTVIQETPPQAPPSVAAPPASPWETRAGLEKAAKEYYQRPARSFSGNGYVTNQYVTKVVREELTAGQINDIIERAKKGQPVPVKYAPLIENAKKNGTWVGEPDQSGNEYTEGWRVSMALERAREKQSQIDGVQNKKITEAQNTANAGLVNAYEAKKGAGEAYLLADRAFNEAQVNKWWGGKATMALAVFLSGLAITLLFLALRWFLLAAIVGGLTFLGLLIMAIASGSGWFVGAVVLLGVLAAAAIMWYVLPLMAGQPNALPNQPAVQQAPVTRAPVI